MFTERQIERILGKLKRLDDMAEAHLFQKADEVDMMCLQTDGSYHEIPDRDLFAPCAKGMAFEGEGIYVWFLGRYQVPAELAGKTLFIRPRIEAYEGMLWVNGTPYGNFASKHVVNTHGNHYCDMLRQNVKTREQIDIALECYSHHYVKGTHPLVEEMQTDFRIAYQGVDICVRCEELSDFYFNLRIALQMTEALDKCSYARAEVIKALIEIHTMVYYDFENVAWDTFMEGICQANSILKKLLSARNSASAPCAGLVGHSHMDTAWLWDRRETEKKCARTFSNQINLMDQYPDYVFTQSSSYHSDIIKRLYPSLFADIQKKVAQGRYEPNGGVWIECDCNIPSGEYMVRQFLWGQRFTRENFGYTSDSFWLPDTFGYSASLPQIMKSCGIRYFLTTKMAWNDTNEFPYNTFYWKGIDGSKVLVHFNRTHVWPDPLTMKENIMNEQGNTILEKEVSNMRLISYGYGDGGGGPEFEMIEIANRLRDVDGLPRSSHTTVSNFMQQLESGLYRPSTYAGELYLELHRGTLTNQHQIKQNNRRAEIALHDLEYVAVCQAVRNHAVLTTEKTNPLINGLLVNQFHDILPGTCIPSAHDDAIQEVSEIIRSAKALTAEILNEMAEDADCITLVNPLSFSRWDPIYLPFEGRQIRGGYAQQRITDLDGSCRIAVAGVEIPGFSSVVLETETYRENSPSGSAFRADGMHLETPFYDVDFDQRGYISSLVDKRNCRQIRGDGYALNTFLIAEDVPLEWDNWDIDADCECKFIDSAELLSRECVADGAVEYRIRSVYQLTEKSTLMQDMIFYASSPEIVFETKMEWQDDHRLLKTAFDTNILTDFASQEIQFGYIRRNTSRNTSVQKAKFEVSNHKYTDLSETRYGVALLNDCKYGISVEGGSMRLSLHKGGCRPDYRGDKGIHTCTYALLPHLDSMHAGNVIHLGYMLNDKPLAISGSLELEQPIQVEADHVIVETLKPAEDGGKCYIARLYEAEGSRIQTKVRFASSVSAIAQTNMLEEVMMDLGDAQELVLEFRPFEIKTLLITFE